MLTAWSRLLASRKFWLGSADLVVSIVTYFVTKYVAPAYAKDILFLLAALQPMAIAIIVGITAEDKAAMAAGYAPWVTPEDRASTPSAYTPQATPDCK